MDKPVSLTGVIITRNEEDRIAGAITSLSCCDEVVVVDAESTDRTRQIAELCGAKVVARSWQGYSSQKNFAAALASHDWVLSIDADERLSIELSNELLVWKSNPHGSGGSMPRRACYLGRWIRGSGWYPDRKLRLYDRRKAVWKGDFVHESLELEGQVVNFSGDLLHIPYRTWTDHVHRIDRYTRLAADAARKAGRHGNVLRLAAGPPLSFLKTFVLRAGFLDGWRGALIAYASAKYVFMRELRTLR